MRRLRGSVWGSLPLASGALWPVAQLGAIYFVFECTIIHDTRETRSLFGGTGSRDTDSCACGAALSPQSGRAQPGARARSEDPQPHQDCPRLSSCRIETDSEQPQSSLHRLSLRPLERWKRTHYMNTLLNTPNTHAPKRVPKHKPLSPKRGSKTKHESPLSRVG